MKLPSVADAFLSKLGFAFDGSCYLRLQDDRLQSIRVDKLRAGVVFNAMISFPSASCPIVSPYELSCVRADGSFGSNPDSEDWYRTWKATSGKELVAALENAVLPQLSALSKGDLSVSLLKLLISPEGDFPAEYDVAYVPRGGTPARYLSLAGVLALLGRFAEADDAFREIPVILRRGPALEIEQAIINRKVMIDPKWLQESKCCSDARPRRSE